MSPEPAPEGDRRAPARDTPTAGHGIATPPKRGRAVSSALFAKATDAAQSARILLDRSSHEGASDRAFFAMFNASRALLATRGLNAAKIRSHSKVRALLSRHFVEPGWLPAEMASSLRRADKVRHASDFGRKGVDPSTARELVGAMAVFMSRACIMIKTAEENS